MSNDDPDAFNKDITELLSLLKKCREMENP